MIILAKGRKAGLWKNPENIIGNPLVWAAYNQQIVLLVFGISPFPCYSTNKPPCSKLQGIKNQKAVAVWGLVWAILVSEHLFRLFSNQPFLRQLPHSKHLSRIHHPRDASWLRVYVQISPGQVMLLNICTMRPGESFGCAPQRRWIWSLSIPIVSISISYLSSMPVAVSLIIWTTSSSRRDFRHLTGKTMW